MAFSQDFAPWRSDRDQIIAGANEVVLPGTVGSLCVFGPKAFPLITAVHSDGQRLPILAAAEAGKGRVVACAHGGYVESDQGSNDTAKLMTRLARWSTRKPTEPIRFGFLRQRGIAKTLERGGHQGTTLNRRNWHAKLNTIDLLVLAGGDFSVADVQPLQAFLAGGGGLIIADAAWVWDGYRKKPGEILSRDHAPSRLLAPVGIVWTRGITERDSAGGVKVQPHLQPETHALGAIAMLERDELKTEQQRNQARVVIEQGFEAIPVDDKLFFPRIDKLSAQLGAASLKAGLSQRRGLSDLKKRIAVGRETVFALRAPVEQTKASSLADQFPARVDPAAARVSSTQTIDTSTPRWRSLGLYAAPGEAITVQVDPSVAGKGLVARIGAHKDRLWHKSRWQRAPEITRTFPVDSAQTTIANAFGGLIYIEVPKDCDLGEIEIRVDGGIESPRYIHGETSLAQWRSLRKLPGPWAEIGSDKIIFTVPSSKVRELDHPDEVMTYWNEVMDTCADLAMISHQRASPERFVIDVQISAGYMHAGYPIMAPRNLADEVLDVETVRKKGNWGVFHEIGHNHQEPEWTYSGMGEVTVNLFSMYVYETLHPGAKQHVQVEKESIEKKIADFEQTGKRVGPWPNLIPYIQLRREFGWDSYRQVFKEYRELSKAERPKSDLEKRSQWMVRFSKQVGRDLSPFFDYWKIETSEEAKQMIADLPDWSPKG
ncbi:MAG: M60 family metallopeptidase [Rubripirellula sp.]